MFCQFIFVKIMQVIYILLISLKRKKKWWNKKLLHHPSVDIYNKTNIGFDDPPISGRLIFSEYYVYNVVHQKDWIFRWLFENGKKGQMLGHISFWGIIHIYISSTIYYYISVIVLMFSCCSSLVLTTFHAK